MPRRRRDVVASPQGRFAWADPERVLGAAPDGEVVFEAPQLRPRTRPARPPRLRSIGLPLGVREVDGRSVCWSCAGEVDEDRLVRAGPGDVRCPGCGAKLPFLI
jgi:hypothetical protein